jgi:hypothetical protein
VGKKEEQSVCVPIHARRWFSSISHILQALQMNNDNPMYSLRNMTILEWLDTQSDEVREAFDKQMHEIIYLRDTLTQVANRLNTINKQLTKALKNEQ